MFSSTIRRSLLAMSTVGLIGLGAAQATADHVHYGFRGERHGFDSEAHMIHALEYMEQAYQSRNLPRLARHYAGRALGELRVASRDVDSRRAEQYLDLGQEDLRKFILTGRYGELDHAAGHVADAIRAEQILRQRQRHDHHHHHHGPQPGGNWQRPGVGGHGWQQPVAPRQGGVFQVGGDWGAFRIRF